MSMETIVTQGNSLPFNVFIQANEPNFATNDFLPACLTPILNKPILYYILEFLERSGFKEATILTMSEYVFSINSELQRFNGGIKCNTVSGKSESFEDLNIFELIQKRLTRSNFILIKANCLYDFDLSSLLDHHLLNNNFLSLVLNKEIIEATDKNLNLTAFRKEALQFKGKRALVYGFDQERIHKDDRKILFSSLISEDNSFKLSNSMLKEHKDIDLECSYQDTELYIFNKSVFTLLKLNKIKEFTNIKTQLIPFLINKSSHRLIKKSLLNDDYLNGFKNREFNGLEIYGRILDNCYQIDSITKIISTLSETQKASISSIPVYFFPTVNNLDNIFTEFREVIYNNLFKEKNPANNLPAYVKCISLDAIVAKGFKNIDSKCKITKSIVGSGLSIRDGSKLQMSVVFNNVSIGKE